ncbi:protein phnG [Azorhizobium oxalatiphilum]|uniref:Protein phnG n=1 Tax=Azorhizobium oxalatiphilum TaxID=980631 RepID=A0A917BLW7_9HYPH|nr:phosphonate C-P lyase system protein PhnG [Azorhizobium oxalatiphilum]GGF49546.1 protein phnG [Azorhizobium oxalatiphilum]
MGAEDLSAKDAAAAQVAARQAMMGLFAHASADELNSAVERFRPLPPIHDLRPAEVGLAMVRGRIGGDGDAFNTGEATVTRAAVRIEGGATGVSYLLGRAPERARAAAILDALWQDTALRPAVEEALAPVRERLAAEELVAREKTEATKVNFFTMVRGED